MSTVIKPVDLTVVDFGIISEAVFTFPVSGGLIYVRGVNKDTPYASSNGSGKSTLINALTWCLYETDTQGDRISSESIRHGQESCSVSFSVCINGTQIKVTRERYTKAKDGSVISLCITSDGETIGTQENAQRWINEQFGHVSSFLASHIYSYEDGYSPYALSSDKEQKTLFDKLLNFEDLDSPLHNAEQEYANVNNSIQLLTTALQRITNKEMAIRYVLLEEKKSQVVPLKELTKELTQEKQHLELAMASLEAAEQEHKVVEKAEKRAEMAYHEANDNLTDYLSTLRPLESLIEAQRVKVVAVKGQTKCGVCGSALETGKWKDILGETWTEYRDNLRLLCSLIDREGDVDERKEKVVQLKKRWDDLIKERSAAVLATSGFREQVRETENNIAGIKTRIQELETPKIEVSKGLRAIESIKAALQDKLDEYKKELEVILFWKEGFGRNGIRAYRLGVVTPRLNEVAQTMSDLLFGDGTRVVYSTQSQLKNGDYRDRFSVVLEKDGKELLRHSAGQAARRDLIHLLTIAIVAQEVRPTNFPLLVLDEAFRTVDAAGVQAAVELLRQLLTKFKTIIVVEHDEELASMFDEEVLVTRHNGQTKIKGIA